MSNKANIDNLRRLLKDFTIPDINPDRVDTATVAATTAVSTVALTSTGIQTHTNASGAYINGKNSVSKQVVFSAASPVIDSGAIYVPGNSLLTKLTVVCVDAATVGSGNISAQAGSTASGVDYAAVAVFEVGTSVNGGVGTSTDTALATALTGDNPLVQTNDTAAWCSGATEVHMRVSGSAAAFTGGKFAFIVEFDHAGGN
mgnify:CR=1 FL=1